jgi:predicted dinucleotide-binding enzyme
LSKNKFITKAFLFFYLIKIGILGSGDVGRRLADGFIELGRTVKIGSRDPNQSKVTEWIDKHNKGKASSGTFADTASFGELDVLATLWAGTAYAIRMADPKNLARKVVIDITNPLDLSNISKGMPPRLAIGQQILPERPFNICCRIQKYYSL